MKLAAFTAKELPFNCPSAAITAALYCDESGVFVRDAVALVSLPLWDLIYTRDTVVLMDMLSYSSHVAPDRTSPQQTYPLIRISTKVRQSLKLCLLMYFCSRFDDKLPSHHNILPQRIDTSD